MVVLQSQTGAGRNAKRNMLAMGVVTLVLPAAMGIIPHPYDAHADGTPKTFRIGKPYT
jgi:hypothetical protein